MKSVIEELESRVAQLEKQAKAESAGDKIIKETKKDLEEMEMSLNMWGKIIEGHYTKNKEAYGSEGSSMELYINTLTGRGKRDIQMSIMKLITALTAVKEAYDRIDTVEKNK